MTLPSNYDAWRLAGPDDTDEVGMEEGEPCNRFEEPDEDAPRGHRPWQCDGMMIDYSGEVRCADCGWVA